MGDGDRIEPRDAWYLNLKSAISYPMQTTALQIPKKAVNSLGLSSSISACSWSQFPFDSHYNGLSDIESQSFFP